jgi:hypothetical protein
MERVKKFPKFSLVLLLTTYTTLGWILAASKAPIYIVLLAAALAMLLAETLAAPFSNLRKLVLRTFNTDGKAFAIVIGLSFFASAIVMWIDVFVRVLVLISAALLARLDLHRSGLGQWQAFWILMLVSLGGFALGWGVHEYFYPDVV